MTDVTTLESRVDERTALEPWRLRLCDAEVLALRASVWGADHPHTCPGFFEWLFGAGNPAGSGSGVVLRRAGNAVGFAGLCPRHARVQGRDVTIAHGLDYMVDRSLGAAGSARYALRVAQEWAAFARAQGYAFGINFPNANSRRLLTSARLGWREVLSPRLMLRPLRGGDGMGLASAARRTGFALVSAALDGAAYLRRGAPAGAARAISLDAKPDAEAVDDLWLRRRDDTSVTLRRDSATLRWRYGLHPLRRYRLLGWEGAEGLAALIVTTRREIEGFPAVLIVDALLDRRSPATARALIAAALRDAAADGASLGAAEVAPGTALARALAGAGFVTVPRRFDPKPFVLVGLPLADAPEAAFSPGAWQFAWGDMDVV
jgi:hypothetical protein